MIAIAIHLYIGNVGQLSKVWRDLESAVFTTYHFSISPSVNSISIKQMQLQVLYDLISK